MSDLHPGLHETDLDRAFAALTSDLSTHSGGPGAGAAIATARKRRRTRVAAVALVAAAAVAAVSVPQLVGNPEGSSIASLPLPAAAPLSAEAMTTATKGWTDAWEDVNEDNASTLEDLDSNCLAQVGGPEAQPQRSGDRVFVSGGQTVALALFADYEEAPAAAGRFAAAFDAGMSACNARVTQSTHGDATVTHGSAGGSGSDGDEMWFARLGDQVAMFAVMGADRPATAGATAALTDLVLGALQEDSSYEFTSGALSLQTGEGSSSETPASFVDITLAQIHEATGAWSENWTNESALESTSLPCVSASWPLSGSWSQGASVGGRGTLTYASTYRAPDEISDLAGSLYACSRGPWSVHEGVGATGTAMWASYDGGSLFAAEHEGHVAMLQVAGLDVPTDDVASGVIDLLEKSLANPESYSGTPPQPSETAEP